MTCHNMKIRLIFNFGNLCLRYFHFFVILQTLVLYKKVNSETTENILEIVYPNIHFTNHERFEVRGEEKGERYKRSSHKLNNFENTNHKETLHLHFNALGRNFNATLNLNKRLLAPNFKIEILGENGKLKDIHGVTNCYYTGKLKDDDKSILSISHCRGLEGIIQTSDEKFSIKPFHHDDGMDGKPPLSWKSRPHIVRRLFEDASTREDGSIVNGRRRRSLEEDGTCGLDNLKPHVRWSRGIMSEKIGDQVIETMLTVDQKMTQYYGMDAAKQYALTVANAAHNILRDSTIGPNAVDLVISKLVILTAPLGDLVINHHARNSLSSFGRWADRRNNVDTQHPDHYDYSILFTRHDICVDRNQPCETKGLSYVGGMCDGARSSAIIEDNGFNSAFTLAHQTGHSLGMDHDGTGNTCVDSKRIMTNDGGKAQDAFHWSPCSIDYLQQFLRKEQSKCLSDDPPRAKREDITAYENPGYLYDADTQCRYAYGDESKTCYEDNTEEMCIDLLCMHPEHHNCTKIGKPAMDGTSCGADKWCKEAVCVQKGTRDDMIIDGGWSQWTDFQSCSRTCGGGISFRERSCQSPRPKHGGKYCEGESRMYIICNKQPCDNATVSFRRRQCENQNLAYYEDHLLNWTYAKKEPDSSCELQCDSTSSTEITKYFGHARDGTECIIGSVPGRCVRGECNNVGCNMLLGSTQQYDRCGVCGGDGSSCTNQIDLNSNPLSISRAEKNADIVAKLTALEEKRTQHMESVAKKLSELREIMKQVVENRCNEDEECLGKLEYDNLMKKGDINSLFKKATVLEAPYKFHWVTSTTGCSVSCGTGIEYVKPECRRVDDGTSVAEAYCNKGTRPFVANRVCERSPCLPRWSASKWSACTRSCGGGRKIRSTYCTLTIDNEEYILPKSQCNDKDKPKQLAICNLGACPAEWFAEPYGECSTTCGQGTRSRTVVCRKVDIDAGTATIVSDEYCSQSPVPVTQMICNAHNPCPGNNICGNIWREKSGNITSPLYPQNYGDNVECIHEIEGEPGKIIRVSFDDIDIYAPETQFDEANCFGDFLRITDGKCSEVGMRPSMKLCGNQIPSYYTSSKNNLCLKFVSDQSKSGKGYSLHYEIKDKEKINQPIKDICDIKGETINSSLGIITSPNYPHDYPINEECRITLDSPDGSGFMIKFDAFQIGTRSGIMDCKNDYLEVYYDDKAQRICGREQSIPTIHIPASTFIMTFHSAQVTSDSKGFVLTYVTKKYAKIYAMNKKAAQNIQDYTQSINDWQQNHPSLSPTEITNVSTIDPISSIKKSLINRQTQGIINGNKELFKILLELADVPSDQLQSAMGKRNKITHPYKHKQKHTARQTTTGRQDKPTAQNHAPKKHDNVPKSHIPTQHDYKNTFAEIPFTLDSSGISTLSKEEFKALEDDLSMYGINFEEASITSEMPYLDDNSDKVSETRTLHSNTATNENRNTLSEAGINQHAPNFKRTNVFGRAENYQPTKSPILSGSKDKSIEQYSVNNIYLTNPLTTFENNVKPSSGIYQQIWRNSIPGGTLPLSKVTPALLKKIQNRKKISSTYIAKKQPTAKQKNGHKKGASISHARITLPVNKYEQSKRLLLKKQGYHDTKETNDKRRTEKAFIPRPPSTHNSLKKTLLTKTSAILQPPLQSNSANIREAWQSPWQQNMNTAITRNQVPYYPIVLSSPQSTMGSSWAPYQPSPTYQSTYPSPYWRTDNMKRQYQTYPFMYLPNFGLFKNRCPPKDSFKCKDIVFHPVCSSDNDCLDLRLGCCETDCPYTQKVCLPKLANGVVTAQS